MCRKSCDMGPNFPFLVFRSRKPCFWFCLGKVASFPSNFFGVGLGKIRPNFSRGKVAGKLGFHCTHSSQKTESKTIDSLCDCDPTIALDVFLTFSVSKFSAHKVAGHRKCVSGFSPKISGQKSHFSPLVFGTHKTVSNSFTSRGLSVRPHYFKPTNSITL